MLNMSNSILRSTALSNIGTAGGKKEHGGSCSWVGYLLSGTGKLVFNSGLDGVGVKAPSAAKLLSPVYSLDLNELATFHEIDIHCHCNAFESSLLSTTAESWLLAETRV